MEGILAFVFGVFIGMVLTCCIISGANKDTDEIPSKDINE